MKFLKIKSEFYPVDFTINNLLAITYGMRSAAIQEKIAQEVRTRRGKARELRSDAESQWEEAKQRFERKLLGDE